MSLFDSASLVVTPNGYKEDKLYSIKPTDGSGDLVVTRATTATRVNSAGLVELVPYNLFTYSEQFDNAAWSKIAGITANATTAPNGTSTADKITESAVNDYQNIFQSVSQNIGKYTYSIYLKKGQNDRCVLFAGSSQALLWIDMTNWTSFSQTNVNSYSIDSVGNGWYRVQFTYTNTSSGNHQTGINLVQIGTTNTVTYLGNTSNGAFIWGAQLVEGSSTKEYFPTTDRLNVPRIDYTNGSCPSILVEPQRTNICLNSNDLNSGSYINQSNTTLTRITSGSPSGGAFDRLVTGGSPGGIGSAGRYLQIGVNSGANATYSVYLKGSGVVYLSFFNGISVSSSNITLTNTWTRYELTSTGGSGTYIDWSIWMRNGGDIIDIAFQQVEFGTYATSYIPTTSASVTRNADVISKTGISSLIGQTEGTLFLDTNINNIASQTNEPVLLYLRGVAEVYIEITPSGRVYGVFYNGTTSTGFINANIGLQNGRHKFAFGYKDNDFILFLDGSQIGTDTSGLVSGSLTEFGLQYYQSFYAGTQAINASALWKTRLTNAELATLTTI